MRRIGQAQSLRRLATASPLEVAAIVLALHEIWIAAFLAAGHDVRDFIKIGPARVTQSHASSAIRYDPTYDYPENRDSAYPGSGFDGQYA